MRNQYLPHHRDLQFLDDERKRNDRFVTLMASMASVFALIILVWLACVMMVDAVVKTAEAEEQETRRRIYASETYIRPAAYRLASPTAEQMERTEAMLQLQPLVRR